MKSRMNTALVLAVTAVLTACGSDATGVEEGSFQSTSTTTEVVVAVEMDGHEMADE